MLVPSLTSFLVVTPEASGMKGLGVCQDLA